MKVGKQRLWLALWLVLFCPTLLTAGETLDPVSLEANETVLKTASTVMTSAPVPMVCVYPYNAASLCPWEWTVLTGAIAGYAAATFQVTVSCVPNPTTAISCPLALSLKAAANIGLIAAEIALLKCIEEGGSEGGGDGSGGPGEPTRH